MRSQRRSKRKATGGLYHKFRDKRKLDLAGYSANTSLGEHKLNVIRTYGGNQKFKLLSEQFVNLVTKEGKIQKVKIKTVLENPANPQLARRNIMTKGCIIETELGKAKVTSRPGQHGLVNAFLV